MALEVGTNAYLDATAADAYFQDYLGADAWTVATAPDRDKALIAATRRIDRLPLVGKKKDEAQVLQFPRCYLVGTRPASLVDPPVFDLLMQQTVEKWECETVVSRSVLDAVCEEALEILKIAGDEQAELRGQLQRQGVTSIKLGSTSETYTTRTGATPADAGSGASLLSEEAEDLLRPYLAASGGIG